MEEIVYCANCPADMVVTNPQVGMRVRCKWDDCLAEHELYKEFMDGRWMWLTRLVEEDGNETSNS